MKTLTDEAAFFWSHAQDWGKTGRTIVTDAQGEIVGTLEWAKDRRTLRVDAPGSRWEFESRWLRERDTNGKKGLARLFASTRYQSIVLIRSVGTGSEVGRYILENGWQGGTLTLRNGATYSWKSEVLGKVWAWVGEDGTPIMRLHLSSELPQQAAVIMEHDTKDTSIQLFLACYLVLVFQDAATADQMITMTTAFST